LTSGKTRGRSDVPDPKIISASSPNRRLCCKPRRQTRFLPQTRNYGRLRASACWQEAPWRRTVLRRVSWRFA